MANLLKNGNLVSEIEEVEVEELGAEVGFIISSCCCSLELEEDDDLVSEIEEVEVEELGAEVGFIISTSCTSLELEEDDDLVEDTLGAVEEPSPEEVMV